ncbi:hypothetical protein SAMN05660748_1062 [Blastococcus aggregatus]|uniref:Uncharacterized protein n=1 Tax=Blastococcus aggregatus TaxID=38502 RepID=A0A285V2L7_9ACTN|nr:hypothetical protein [Blastococcus aggregatus]SOC47828.1 hypothetical protein SAMN05660748_1062 [Blastococcus aggregatus]
MNDFLPRVARLHPTADIPATSPTEETQVRVYDALCAISSEPSRALELREALIDDIVAGPAECLPQALTELHALAAFLINHEVALHGFCDTGVESTTMWNELSSLMSNPYRYAAGQCDHVGPTLEHLRAVAGLVMVMVMAWPAEVDGCPVCCFVVEEHGPEDFVMPPHPSAVQSA